MEPLITAVVVTWLLMRGWEALKAEYGHVRDRHATDLARQHADWSPAKIGRHARRRAHAMWLTELAGGFPTFRHALAADRLLARVAVAEAKAAGERTRRELLGRLEAAKQERQDACEDPAPEPGTGNRGLTLLPGGNREPQTAPEPQPVPEPRPAPEPPAGTTPGTAPGTAAGTTPGTTPEAAGGNRSREPGTTDPEPQAPAAEPWDGGDGTPRETELREARRCVEPLGADEDGTIYCAAPAAADSDRCAQHAPFTAYPEPGTVPGDEGEENMSAALESADSPFESMLAYLDRGRKTAGGAVTDAEDLAAGAAVHGFNRDSAFTADMTAIDEAAQALAAAYETARAGLAARHADGAEYHSNGSDAHATAFRAV